MCNDDPLRRRRIKCDEGKPNCLRCIRSDRECEGYKGEHYARQREELPVCGRIATYSIPFRAPGSQADRQLLHHYCCQTASSLYGYSDPTLWTSLVLQRCQQEPIIRHALVTLSSLHLDHLRGEFQQGNPPSPTSIQLILKCHHRLRLYLSTPAASLEVALICSIIFYAFESLVGDIQQAIWHLDQGLMLWQRCQLGNPYRSSRDEEDLFWQLGSQLSRLDIQASTFNDDRAPTLMLISPAEKYGMSPIVPTTFLSPIHAEHVLTKLQNWMLHLLIKHAQPRPDIVEGLFADLLHEKVLLQAQFNMFGVAIDRLAGEGPATLAHQILLLRAQARIYHAVLLEKMASSFPSCELSASNLLRSAITDIAALLSAPPGPNSISQGSFTLSTQLVSGLYFACLKTTNRLMLEEGLALLQHPMLPCRDGVWDAQMVRSVIRSVMERDIAWSSGEIALGMNLEARGSDILDINGGVQAIYNSLQSVNR